MLTKFLVNGLQQTLHALELVVNRIDGLIDPFPEQPAAPAEPYLRPELEYRSDELWARPVMWWEMAFGGVGVASYLTAAACSGPVSRAAGWTLVLGGKGSLLMADLGRPERALRVFTRPNTSWISRGAWALLAFSGGGVGQLLLWNRPVLRRQLEIGTALAATVLISYDGLFLNASKSVSSWTARSLPVLLTTNSLVAGATMTRLLDQRQDEFLRAITVASAVASAIAGAGWLRELRRTDDASRHAADQLTRGGQRGRFWLGVGLLGTAIPAVVAAGGGRNTALKAVAAAASLLGAAWLRKTVLQTGYHAPILRPVDEGGWPW